MATLSEPRVTASEAVAVLQRLEPRLARDLTDRRFAYAAGAAGAARLGVRGWTVLYGPVDLALVRLMLRLEAEISIPVARFTVGYLAGELRQLLESGRLGDMALVVPKATTYPRRMWPRLMSAAEARREGVEGVLMPLRDVAAGIREAMREKAAEEPLVRLFQPVSRSTAAVRVLERMEELVGANA